LLAIDCASAADKRAANPEIPCLQLSTRAFFSPNKHKHTQIKHQRFYYLGDFLTEKSVLILFKEF
jgi:hypothetical protein